MIGKTLGHYSVSSLIGRGGMGEVYRAKDQKLGRDVAIKVLPEEFARDSDRVARFQREAKLLASLNHPNIAAIHGLEESDGTHFLILELIEGDTLADKIKRGPIPIEESLKLALQIAEAIEAAHEKGVIHRDLKPANIKVTPDGKVKVLDFGLAKAFAGGQREGTLTYSPTLSELATQQGIILGTVVYMSPEQAKGKTVDKRTDIFSFGVVLYEMLTGGQLFEAETVSETLAAVLTKEPNWEKVPAMVRSLLRRCLQKDSNKRLRDINAVKLELEEVLANPGDLLAQPAPAADSRTKLRMMLLWLAAAIALVAIIAGVAVWKMKSLEPRQVMRFYHELPEDQQFNNLGVPQLAVSPNGRQFVYSTNKGLYLRSVDELTAKLIAGSDGNSQQPFFSPDGKWIGYVSVADQKLKKIPINGGIPVTLREDIMPLAPSWGTDDTIVYGVYPGSAIMRISANGGTPETLVKGKSWILAVPQILPDGKSVLYTEMESTTQSKIMLQTLKSEKPKELFPGIIARYLPTGHMVYDSDKVYAVPFDIDRLEVSGEPIPMVEGVRQAAFSDSGTLVYIPQTTTAVAPERTLVWVGRNGQEEPLAVPPNMYRFPNISPDGTRVAITVHTGSNSDIWIWNLAGRTLTRLTFDGSNMAPAWTPDGKRIAFFSGIAPAGNYGGLYWKPADGAGEPEILGLFGVRAFRPDCWSSDGKALVGSETLDRVTWDIGMLSMEGDRTRKPLLQGKYLETQPKVSRDGRWIAYTSSESGRNEVYVRSFPDMSKGKWQISVSGGDSALWSPDGRELFYLHGDEVMAASVQTDPSFNLVGTPKVLFRGKYVSFYAEYGSAWDIHPDGKRFLMMKEAGSAATEAAGPRRINIVLNWTEELKQRVPMK